MKKDNEHTEEHKQANKKKVKVGSKEKLLLFDNEEFGIEDEDFAVMNNLGLLLRLLVAVGKGDRKLD